MAGERSFSIPSYLRVTNDLNRALTTCSARHRTVIGLAAEFAESGEWMVTWRNEPDGMVTFSARLPPLTAGALIARLTTHVMTPRHTADGPFEEWPSLAQQHADALDHLAREGGGALMTELVIHAAQMGRRSTTGRPRRCQWWNALLPRRFCGR